MAYSYLTGTANSSTFFGLNGGYTAEVDCTGVDLIIVACPAFNGSISPLGITDDLGNTYTQLAFGDSSSYHIALFYCQNPTVSTTQKWTRTGSPGGSAISIAVACFSGSVPTPLDQDTVGTGSGASSYQAGTVTPGQDNELVIAAVASASTGPTIDSGFTVAQFQPNSGDGVGIAIGYLVQTSATAENPTWTLGAAFDAIGINASFFGSNELVISPTAPAIPSAETWFSPALSGGVNNISPPLPAINTGEHWPTPAVAGPITIAAIPTSEHWFTPTIGLGQTVRVGTASPPTVAIPSGESWPTPRVANVQTISLAAPIPSGEAWFTPQVVGSPRWVNVVGIPSGENWPTPAIHGGNVGTFLFLSGEDVSGYLMMTDGTCSVQSQTLGRWQANWDMYLQPSGQSSPYVPVLGQTVLLMDFGDRIFTGCISQVDTRRSLGTSNVTVFHCTATDKSGICDHRVVVGATYPAIDPISNQPNSVQTVILAIVTNFLNGEGINPAGVPNTLGNLAADLSWNFPTVTQAFDQICTDNGLVWWVDENMVLHFSSLDTLPAAPFDLTEDTKNWWNLTSTQTTTNYYNKLYAVSNLNILPGGGSGSQTGNLGVTDDYPNFAVGQPGIVKAFFTVTNQFIAVAFNTSVAIGSVISLTVNGNPQTVVDFTQFNGQTRTGPTDYLWFFGPNSTTVAWTFQPPNHSVIEINYVPATSTNASNAQYGDALAPSIPGLGTCGSGIYEGVMQLQNVSTVGDLNAIAAAELLRLGGVPTIVNFVTRYPGLRPGQLLYVDVPNSGVPNKHMLITQVSGVWKPPDLFKGSAFEWTVEATTQLDPGNWIKWYERLVGRTVNPLPVLQYEEAVWVLGAGASIAGGNSITNPYIVGRTGLLVQLLLAAGNPPVDQDLVMQVTRAGTIIASITLPRTAAANQLFQFNQPTNQPIYLFAGDTLNLNTSYNVFGTAPQPASNATLKVRWSI